MNLLELSRIQHTVCSMRRDAVFLEDISAYMILLMRYDSIRTVVLVIALVNFFSDLEKIHSRAVGYVMKQKV